MAIIKATKTPARPAPISETSVLGWLQKNLFSSAFNTLLTLIMIYIIYLTVSGVYVWGFADATFVAETRRECYGYSLTGACWAGAIDWLDNIFYGRYPREEIWRINFGGLLLALWMAPLWIARAKGKALVGASVVVFYPFLAGYLFSGGDKGLFMQVMVSGAIAAFAINMANVTVGLLKKKSIAQFVIRSLGQTNAADRTQRNLLIALVAIGLAVAYFWQSSWTVEYVSWLGLHKEPLIFGAILFFIICFSMSKYSRHLEVKLSAGNKH